MRTVGFKNTHTLPFPQPVYPTGWWSNTMAVKSGNVSTFRTKDSRNKSFETDYYNVDIHQGALATPEFMKKTLKD